MADKTPVRVVFNASDVATGLAEFQSGDTIGTAFGGTGLTAIGTAGQVLKVNAAADGLEFGAEGDISITNLVAPSNADLTFTTSGTGNIVLDGLTVRGTTLSAADSSTININEGLVVDGTATVSGALASSTSLALASGATVTGIADEDNMSSNSATLLATQQSIKAYVDTQLTAEDLDFQADSGGALSIDLDSETMTFTGGTGIDTSGSGNAVTFAIDSTVATLTGSQTLTNKTITSPTIATPTVTGTLTATSVTTNDIVSNGSNADITLDPTGTGDINLTAGADVNIPADIGLTFGDDGEKIEGDGTNLTISSSGTTTIDSTGDIILDADSGDIELHDDGTKFMGILNSGGVFISSSISNRDMKFTGNDGGFSVTALTLDMSEAGAATFNSSVTATSLITNTIQSNGSNADLSIQPSGTGDVLISALRVNGTTIDSSDSSAVQINENTEVDGTLTVTGAVAITSGTITGITDLTVADGGTGASSLTNNAVLTGTGTSAITAEGNLSFDGSTLAVTGAVTISGDLTVSGDTATVSTTNTTIEDNIIELNTGISQSLNDAGIIIERGSTGDNAAIIWDESADTFVLGTTTAGAGDKSGGITITAGALEVAALTATTGTFSGAVTSVGSTVTGNFTAGQVTTNDIISNGSNADITIDPAGTGNINLTAGADVVIPVNIGLVLDGSGAEKIESDGTDISFSVGANGDINIPADIGLTFGNDGEKIEGDGTDLTITGNNINLTATADVIIPTNVGLHFTDANEKIESDGSKLVITSGGTAFNLPTSDGSNGNALVTDGSGTLSFGVVGDASASDDSAGIAIADKRITSTARTIDSWHSTFQDSVLYYMVSNDHNEDCVNVQKVSVCHNDSDVFLTSAGAQSKASTTMTAFTAALDNDMVRVKAASSNAVGGTLSFYKFGLGDNTSTGTSGNVIISQNTDVDSASESLVSFAHGTYRGAKLFISINNNAKTEVGNVEALVVHDGSDAFITQFGVVQTGNNDLLTLTAAIDGSNVVVSAAGGEANLRVTVHAIMLKDTMVSDDGTYANTEAIAPVTISSTATEVDTVLEASNNGAVYYLVSKNATEGAYAVNEVFLAMGSGEITVASTGFVSTKGTNQLTFTADYKDDAENTGQLLCASTSGGSTTVSAYRINALAK